jgi:hypothetical protein
MKNKKDNSRSLKIVLEGKEFHNFLIFDNTLSLDREILQKMILIIDNQRKEKANF